ncbi:MAG: beta-ketoacyl-ACP synthase II [Bacteroidota bacterium]|nr:beta-ketoacyl-ACP synthase II [Candidatus Kapabacteria bacterium]MDW8220715.1 beta-ketoacyl-ACP synthase II [Bacteroidota bacterium]
MSRYSFPTIVVTGIGVVSPIGNSKDEFWQAMMLGKSGAGPITRFDATCYDTHFACEVKNFDVQQFVSRKEAQRMDPFTHYAIAAAEMALLDAGLDINARTRLNNERVGVVFGSGIGGMWTYHKQQEELYKRGGNPDRISPFFVPMLIANIAAGYIAIRYGFKGPNYGTVSACATSSHCIADAMMLLQRGDADVILAGGSEAVITPMGIGGFAAMRALSTRNDAPEKASRPFDKERSGFVMGEGGAVLVLETLDHAQRRGARIYAVAAGFGLTDDAYHITQPAEGGEGAVRSMRLALHDARLQPKDIGYINAHGTSTPLNDKTETAAIKTVFGEHAYKLAVSSTKSMTGHLLGAAGAVEAAATVLALYHGILPPTINYEVPDPDCDLFYVPNIPVQRNIDAAISNTFGFGGHNVSLCFTKPTVG